MQATEQTYQIETLVDDQQEWQDDPITAGVNYSLGDDLNEVAKDLAEIALENTSWHTMPSRITVVIESDDDARNELARFTLRHDPLIRTGRQWLAP